MLELRLIFAKPVQSISLPRMHNTKYPVNKLYYFKFKLFFFFLYNYMFYPLIHFFLTQQILLFLLSVFYKVTQKESHLDLRLVLIHTFIFLLLKKTSLTALNLTCFRVRPAPVYIHCEKTTGRSCRFSQCFAVQTSSPRYEKLIHSLHQLQGHISDHISHRPNWRGSSWEMQIAFPF